MYILPWFSGQFYKEEALSEQHVLPGKVILSPTGATREEKNFMFSLKRKLP